MHDEEYEKVEREFKKLKRSRIGKLIIKDIEHYLFTFFLEGYKYSLNIK